MLFFIFVLLFLQPADSETFIDGLCVDCLPETLVPAGGSDNAAPLIRQLAGLFQLLNSNVQLNYVSQTTETALQRLQTPCRKTYEVDFAAIDYPISVWEEDNTPLSSDLQSVPFAGAAAAISYHLPEFTPNVDPDLRLSRENIYDIYSGSITNWNDTRLQATNPAIASRLPNASIWLVLRSEINPCCGMVGAIIKHINSSFPWDSHTHWPSSIRSLPNAVMVQGAQAAGSAITVNPYYLGTLSQAIVEGAGLPVAQIENQAGVYSKPGEGLGVYNSIIQAINTETGNYLIPADLNCSDCYPLSQMLYFAYHTSVNAECDARVAFAKFTHWMLTDDNARRAIYSYTGFISLPDILAQQVLTTVGNLTCLKVPLLQTTFQDYGGDALTQAITIVSIVFIFVSVAILSTLSYKRNNRITRAAGLAFAIFFLLGCIFNYISVIFFITIPISNAICIGRFSFVCLGYSLILGAMFAKCWEISKIFYRAEKGDISPFKELPWYMFCRAFGAVASFELLFLIIWLSVDPPLVVVRVIDNVNLISVHECTTKNPSVWYGLHFSYFAVVLIWGAYLAYMTRDIWQKYNFPNESRSILISIYNLAFCAVILAPLVTALDASPEVLVFLISVAIIFPTTFALVVVHGPKVLAFLASSISQGSKGSRNTGGPQHKDLDHSRHESHTVKLIKAEREKEIVSEDMSPPALHLPNHRGSLTELQNIQVGGLKGIRILEDIKSKHHGSISVTVTRTTDSGTTTTTDRPTPPLGPSWKVLNTPECVDANLDVSGYISPSPRNASTPVPDSSDHSNPLFGESV